MELHRLQKNGLVLVHRVSIVLSTSTIIDPGTCRRVTFETSLLFDLFYLPSNRSSKTLIAYSRFGSIRCIGSCLVLGSRLQPTSTTIGRIGSIGHLDHHHALFSLSPSTTTTSSLNSLSSASVVVWDVQLRTPASRLWLANTIDRCCARRSPAGREVQTVQPKKS